MQKKLGVVLGGGGSRGLAHIGVLDTLQQEGIFPDIIVGTSMGAIVGTAFAIGVKSDELSHYLGSVKGSNLITLNLFSAKSRQQIVKEHLSNLVGHQSFNNTEIALAVIAVDAVTGREIKISSGKLLPALLASSAIPVVFPPVKHMDMQLIDGGVIDSLSTGTAYEMGADIVIAVDIWPPLPTQNIWTDPFNEIMGFDMTFNIFGKNQEDKDPSMLAALWRSYQIMASHIHDIRLEQYPAHILLRPDVAQYGSLDFSDIEGPISAGKACITHHLDEIKRLLAQP